MILLYLILLTSKILRLLSLDKDVKLNEPKLALSGGKSGLNKVFKVIKKMSKTIKNKWKAYFRDWR